jgi:hypothetical protein
MRANFADGLAMLEGRVLLVTRGKYTLIDRDTCSVEDATCFGIPGTRLTGKPTIDGNRMYLSNRVRGTIQVVDISQLDRPRLLDEIQLDEHPGPIVIHDAHTVIPAGYQGLLVWQIQTDQ